MSNDFYRVAIVGAASLKGKELKDALSERNFPALDVKLLDDETPGQLDAMADEATFIQRVTAEQLENVDLVFFAGDEKFTRDNWSKARKSGAAVVDMSYALENEQEAEVRAPELDKDAGKESVLIVPAHPAAVVLARLLRAAGTAAKSTRAIATIFEPASEQGRRGMDELHQQTVNLLSFQSMPTDVYDSQVAFNMMARFGEKSTTTLETSERRILSHFQKITGGALPVPSLVLVHAPVFHGHAFSVYIELEKNISVGDFSQALTGGGITVARGAEDAPSNVSAAGQEQVLAAVRRDATSNGLWLWAVADNLRIAANTAVDCGRVALAARAERKA
jgi:aspartate-semialdehyde dehydrogenase